MLHPKRLGSTTILDAWRLFSRGQSARTLTKDTKDTKALARKPLFRKHVVQPHFDERIKTEKRERVEARFQRWWAERRAKVRLSPPLRLPTSQALPQAESLTQEWLSKFSIDGTVVPRRLSHYEFPAGKISGYERPPGPPRRRTDEDKRRVEAVLTTPISALTEYVSPKMIEMIKESPLITRGENVVVFRSHQYPTRRKNLVDCFRLLSRFIKNVASEIVYREQLIAAEERMYNGEEAFDYPEYVKQ